MEASIAGLSRYQISQFFRKHSPPTQQECDTEAERITGTSVRSATVQGGTSYTVVGGTVVVQFRAGDSALDLQLLECAEQAYAGFTPHHESAGKLGELHIYTMNDVSGISMYLARVQLQQDDCYLLQQTLQDYARFFVSAWHNTPDWMTCPSREVLFADYSSQLLQLSQGLPPRFRPTLDRLIPQLPQIFASDWPMVPNHTDLLENNIHVNPSTGKLTGICDWKDTEVSPFGMSLGGLETMLGIGIRLEQGTKTGWRYHANQQTLRKLFWQVFYDAMGNVSQEQRDRVEVARLVGLFLANGFEYDKDENKVPATEGSDGLGYLDGVVLGLSAST